MTVDHSDEVGYPASPGRIRRTRRPLSQYQKGSLLCNRQRRIRAREAARPLHPPCGYCSCERCKGAR